LGGNSDVSIYHAANPTTATSPATANDERVAVLPAAPVLEAAVCEAPAALDEAPLTPEAAAEAALEALALDMRKQES
jgi:hypothetical protein